MHICLHSQYLMSTSIHVVIQLFHSVSSCPYRKDGLFVDTNLQLSRGLYLVNKLATMVEVFEEFAQQQMEGCSGFVFSEEDKTFFALSVSLLQWHLLSVFATLLFSQSLAQDLKSAEEYTFVYFKLPIHYGYHAICSILVPNMYQNRKCKKDVA